MANSLFQIMVEISPLQHFRRYGKLKSMINGYLILHLKDNTEVLCFQITFNGNILCIKSF